MVVCTPHPEQQPSARNLVDYLGWRQLDLRELQDRLASVGLSSLGRSEGQVMPALDALLGVLDRLVGYSSDDGTASAMHADSMSEGERRLTHAHPTRDIPAARLTMEAGRPTSIVSVTARNTPARRYACERRRSLW